MEMGDQKFWKKGEILGKCGKKEEKKSKSKAFATRAKKHFFRNE